MWIATNSRSLILYFFAEMYTIFLAPCFFQLTVNLRNHSIPIIKSFIILFYEYTEFHCMGVSFTPAKRITLAPNEMTLGKHPPKSAHLSSRGEGHS